ncbi:unnamed protein product [Clonostachys rosea]|uniref:Nephrocystin 3-like N-terminal domain-containing protein n=1 Tax=Bionectria ochroleuca TaxID=29856 RepID=A0ABY6TNB5_BIOOC|nr:unnamed protein product [Clonostachys rosea]
MSKRIYGELLVKLPRNDKVLIAILEVDTSRAQTDQENCRLDDEFQEVTRWLSSLDFAAKQVDFFNRRQRGTGEWLLSDARFKHWLEGKERTLWCPGLPGAGKTTLAYETLTL